MQAVLVKATGQVGIIRETGTLKTGRPLRLVQVETITGLEWFKASEVRPILTLVK